METFDEVGEMLAENVINLNEVKLERQFVFKKDGKGNKNFNAFFVKSVNVEITSAKGKIISETDILIGYRNSKGLEKINGSLSFILNELWGGTESNPKSTRAQHIVKFLNWTLLQKQYYAGYNSLSDLTVEMVIDYLNRTSYDYAFDTHQYCKSTLIAFFSSLISHNIVVNINIDIESAFNNIRTPIKYRKIIKHTLPKPLITVLVDICEIECPEILLGVMLGILSGIRRGEIVNLSRSAIAPVGIYDYSLEIKDRMLRPDIANPRVRGCVKIPRKQKVYNSYIGIELFGDKKFKEVYNRHIQNYKPIDSSNALFVGSDGKAMTASNLSKKFTRVKEKFIQQLDKHSDPILFSYAKRLKTDKWSVHILRGIFSNMYAEMVGPNGSKELQMARGDSSPLSALRYLMDIDKINEQQEEAVKGQREMFFKKKPLVIKSFKANFNIKDSDNYD